MLAFYSDSLNVIAHGDDKTEALKNLKKMHKEIQKKKTCNLPFKVAAVAFETKDPEPAKHRDVKRNIKTNRKIKKA